MMNSCVTYIHTYILYAQSHSVRGILLHSAMSSILCCNLPWWYGPRTLCLLCYSCRAWQSTSYIVQDLVNGVHMCAPSHKCLKPSFALCLPLEGFGDWFCRRCMLSDISCSAWLSIMLSLFCHLEGVLLCVTPNLTQVVRASLKLCSCYGPFTA